VNDTEHAEVQRRALLEGIFGERVPDSVDGQLLRTSDVAALFQVSERTVSEWARRGRIPSVRTPGGHRRYPANAIRELLTTSHGGDPPADLLASVAAMAETRSR
jgi:excisionase family DNA binding protein